MYLSRVSAHQRSFVSTVLLSRTWENLTVLELRKEAKARGLSTGGNKSTLVSRIKQHEQNTVTSSPPPASAIRSASIDAAPPPHPKRPFQGAAPGIPLATQPDRDSARSDFLAVKLPDLARPPPSASVQVPYVPDFWDSARPMTSPPLEPERPKLHVVGGSATHYDGGPTHNLEKPQESDPSSVTVQTDEHPAIKEARFWPEFWEGLGLPRSFSIRPSLSQASRLAAQSGEDEPRAQSRPLTGEERKGLYVLFGIVAGSWLVGGLVNRSTVTIAEEHDTRNQH